MGRPCGTGRRDRPLADPPCRSARPR
jgi:hypothetical protein